MRKDSIVSHEEEHSYKIPNNIKTWIDDINAKQWQITYLFEVKSMEIFVELINSLEIIEF